ncbi:cytochrome c [Deinococcus sp.]|uniref:c-type cytochrome n=1 Tax=Deinococcus sp. TaxID=47478 RepID=UPI0025B9F7BC|nr:cytochrome c [Deinococcus sp.]
MIYAVLVLGIFMLVLLLWPALGPARVTPEDTRRTELEEEREQLLDNLRELEAGSAGDAAGPHAEMVIREKVRLAQVLQELDALPPAAARAGRPALPVALLALGVTGFVTLGGLYTVFPQWRYAGLPTVEAAQLRNASALPGLEQRATRTGALADLNAWGDAAWQAQNYSLASRAYTQVLVQQRSDAKALRRVGFFLLKDPKMAENGLGFIQRSVALAPRDPEGQLYYGYALGLFGQYDAGLQALNTYRALAPDEHEADALITQYQQKTGAGVDGRLVFAQNCAVCHGQNLEGGRGPKLLGSAALRQPEALKSIVLHGATGMPAFPQLQGKQLGALVEYLGRQ